MTIPPYNCGSCQFFVSSHQVSRFTLTKNSHYYDEFYTEMVSFAHTLSPKKTPMDRVRHERSPGQFVAAFQSINNDRDLIHRIMEEYPNRFSKCIELDGGHVDA